MPPPLQRLWQPPRLRLRQQSRLRWQPLRLLWQPPPAKEGAAGGWDGQAQQPPGEAEQQQRLPYPLTKGLMGLIGESLGEGQLQQGRELIDEIPQELLEPQQTVRWV